MKREELGTEALSLLRHPIFAPFAASRDNNLGVAEINHRELILSAQKKPKFGFLTLPEDLQDEIVDGLDSGALTLTEASKIVKAGGKSLSHDAIAAYYRAVRRERRLYDTDEHRWTRMEGAARESI